MFREPQKVERCSVSSSFAHCQLRLSTNRFDWAQHVNPLNLKDFRCERSGIGRLRPTVLGRCKVYSVNLTSKKKTAQAKSVNFLTNLVLDKHSGSSNSRKSEQGRERPFAMQSSHWVTVWKDGSRLRGLKSGIRTFRVKMIELRSSKLVIETKARG